jgi:ribosomal protein S18 acetylase RimI-like enzyme
VDGAKELDNTVAQGISVRDAVGTDRIFLYELFIDALNQFYAGDHKAHVDRILDTHLAGGQDSANQFSAHQRTLIAVSQTGAEEQLLGVLHLTEKRQRTIKISPLIVSPQYRSAGGIGTLLLSKAIEYSRQRNARKLFCTVSAANHSALGFFQKAGFVQAGEALDHYKPGTREFMFYYKLADLEDTSGWTVRQYEADDFNQVDAFLKGHSAFHFVAHSDTQRLNANVGGAIARASFDVFHLLVDQTDTVRGIASASPKKGGPVKVLPLCGDTQSSFSELVDRLPALYEGYGHKLYTHQDVSVTSVSVMQRAGWRLDGLLPGAHKHDMVTAQWSLKI